MGGAVSAGEDNDDLIDNLLEAEYIKSSYVERVFRAVDRAHYFTPEYQDNAYKDLAWKSGNLHLSAPCIYSEVLESLKLQSGLSFLNLGSGTGYLSTMVGLILGPYGTNHGIEIHEDVVQYANKKLEEFRRISPALDEYELCEPKFMKGNCLSLNSSILQYDRVYCGAACPENYENFMKNLIKIGGILVMPLNDQLLQILRTSETTWDVKSVLPVSFAPLILPGSNEGKEHIKLPKNEPLLLQDACRTTIRSILRRNVEIEHPGLKIRKRPWPKKIYKKRALRRLVIPIFEESDNEELGSDGGDARRLDYGRAGLLYEGEQRGSGQVTAVIELARNLRGQLCQRSSAERDTTEASTDPQSSDDSNIDDQMEEQASASSASLTEQRKNIPKREKIDSGMDDEIENGKGLSSDSEEEEDGENMEADSDSDFYDMVSYERMRTESGESNRGEERLPLWTFGSRPGTRETVIWNRLPVAPPHESERSQASHGVATEESDRSEDEVPNVEPDQSYKVTPPVPELHRYGTFMRCKIQALPLPSCLKGYLNLNREF